ncbi:MAG: hypothetical protein L0Z50_38140, partial [Verrucomicrobiales bacterium]|nr:hypothetical protein [Verrucomicrobiales bacterium]
MKPLLPSALTVSVMAAWATSAFALDGTVQSLSWTGPVTGRPVNFSLYLPPGYATSTNRCPVIYHLHGINGTHNGQQTNTVPASHEAAVAAGVIAVPHRLPGWLRRFVLGRQREQRKTRRDEREIGTHPLHGRELSHGPRPQPARDTRVLDGRLRRGEIRDEVSRHVRRVRHL